jgi:ketosteroid isomerase-like protein
VESSPGIDLVRSAIDAYNRRDAEAFCARAHEHVVLRPPVSLLQGKAYTGHDGVRHWLHDIEEGFDHARIEVDDLSDVDYRVLMLGRFCVRGRGSETDLVSELGVVCELREGLLVRWDGFLSHVEAIRAAEMAEC